MSKENSPRRRISIFLWLLSVAILATGLVVWVWAQVSGVDSLMILISSPPYAVRILDVEFIALVLGVLIGFLGAIAARGKPIRKL